MKYLSIFTKSFFAILLGVLFLTPASSQATPYGTYVKQTVEHFCGNQSAPFKAGCYNYMHARLEGSRRPQAAKELCESMCDNAIAPPGITPPRQICKDGCLFMLEGERR